MPKLSDLLLPDHPAYTEAFEAMRRYDEARDAGVPASEVEKLRIISEALFQALTDYQMRAFGCSGGTIH